MTALAGVALIGAGQAWADEPIVTFHTNIYETYGPTNSFHITLGATEDTYVDIDYGFGLTEEEVGRADFDSDAGEMTGTAISITVSDKGMVKIYGDATKIDYVDFEGCYIDQLEMSALTNVQILNLKHNELKALDLTPMTKLMALYLDDNPFSQASPLVVGSNKPELAILSMSMTDWVSSDFNISDYPRLASFQAYGSPSLTRIDPTGCPQLLQLTIDGSNVSTIDVSKNPNLLILNVSETKVTELDLSHNPYLTELYIQHEAEYNGKYKFKTLDVTKNPELVRLYINGNRIEELDLSNNSKIMSFACRRNALKALNFDNCPQMTLVDISKNYMTYTTMPLPRTTFSEYDYEQYPMPMQRSYAEGTEFDFTDKVMRDDSQTAAALFAINREDPSNPILLDDEYFTFDDGKFTVNKAYGDSVYVAFHNTAFAEYDLTTAKFMVKTAEDMGKPTATIALTTSILAKEQSFYVGIDGATSDKPVEFQVDFGDGTLVPFTATTSGIPAEANVSGARKAATTTIYVAEGIDLTALKIDGLRLNGMLDCQHAPMLRELVVNNAYLPSVNLKWNRCLTLVDLSHNNLSTVDLSEPNPSYAKTVLGHIYLNDNKISTFETVDPYGLVELNLANNQLTKVVTTHATGLQHLNIANNKIAELSLTDCEALQTLDASGNNLTELFIPDYAPLTKVNIAGNNFSLPAIPTPGFCQDYTYAPQGEVKIPTKAPSANLTAQLLGEGQPVTTYEWRYASDDSPVSAADITSKTPGRFIFSNPNTGLVYCAMTNEALPQFSGKNALRTTNIQTADVPDNMFASFVPTQSGNITFVLASAVKDNEIYVDWTGDGDYDQYILETSYVDYAATTTAGVPVKMYSYNDNDNVSVMSVRNTSIESLDVSKMKALYCLGLSGTKITFDAIKFPTEGKLTEFIGDGCGFTSIDAEALANVEILYLSNNKLETLDVSSLRNLTNLYASGNGMKEVKFDNPRLWDLNLNLNNLTSVDLSKLPSLNQLYLTNNSLTELDVDKLSALKVLYIDANNFDFTTLPARKSSYIVYYYVNQKPLIVEPHGATVDLSSQASRNGIATSYQWFIDTPYFDETGNLIGEDLYLDEEYTLDNGVTTFLKPFSNVMCVMTNAAFPNLYLYTNLMDIEVSGIENVSTADADAPAEYYDLRGIRVANPSAGQVYIRRQGTITDKVKF